MPKADTNCQKCETPMHWAFYSDQTYELECPICKYYELYHEKTDQLLETGHNTTKDPRQELYEYEDGEEEWMV